jgi:hypothetical protein
MLCQSRMNHMQDIRNRISKSLYNKGNSREFLFPPLFYTYPWQLGKRGGLTFMSPMKFGTIVHRYDLIVRAADLNKNKKRRINRMNKDETENISFDIKLNQTSLKFAANSIIFASSSV